MILLSYVHPHPCVGLNNDVFECILLNGVQLAHAHSRSIEARFSQRFV